MAVMEFGILGPLEVRADGREVELGGPKPRALLAVLALHANQPITAERVAVALWGEETPPRAVKTVQVYVARLRRALGDPDVLVTMPGGYCLRVRPGELDAERFESQVAAGRQELAAGRAGLAGELLRKALALWRGAALAELASLPFAPAEIARLEELHVAAVELRVEADLAAGRHAELVAELQQLTIRHPWRERLHGQLMLALYRSGRQADALEAYRHAREVLIDQLGIEPGAELRDRHQAMLGHDPALAAPRVTVSPAFEERDAAAPVPGALGEHGLPLPPNRTIGRERELAALGARLRRGSVRLLTLTGTGGVGKTRLALEAARAVDADFADGAHLVSLATVRRPEDVPAALVQALGIIVLSGESPDQAAKRFLAAKHLLLVADNCEHLLGAAPFIGRLMGACPALTVLATSREPLGLQAEQRYPVPPLALPERATHVDPEAVAGVDAVALFTERARAHDPGFALDESNALAVAEICRRVDGLPLAIELAAAHCALLSAAEIAERLDRALGAPGAGARDAPARHQTLRATIDWSHTLLNDAEKAGFARFAVFAGGATVDAAETITGAAVPTLEGLHAKSLLVRRRGAHTPTRLAMLETVRTYAREKLAGDAEEQAVRERHYRYHLELALRHGSERALQGASGKLHLAGLDDEFDNLYEALGWAVCQATAEPALAMCAGLGRYWWMSNRCADSVDWIDRALSVPGAQAHPVLRVRALCIKVWSLRWIGRVADQPAVAAEAEAIARRLDDPVTLSQALQTRAKHETIAGRLEVAGPLAEEALQCAITAGDDWEIANAWSVKAMAAPTGAELSECVQRAASLLEQVGNVHQLGDLLGSAAYRALCLGSDRDAKEFVERAAPIARGLDDLEMLMMVQGNSGLAALLTGDTDAAARAFREELILCRELVIHPNAAEGLLGLAGVAAACGDLRRAARLVGAASAHRYGQQQQVIEDRLDTTFLERSRTRHGPAAWDAEARDGATLSFEDALAYALEKPRAEARTTVPPSRAG